METPMLSYASFHTQGGTCPLCHMRPVWKKSIYQHRVCKKCFYAFANRRQLAYLLDALFVTPINAGIVFAMGELLRSVVSDPVLIQIVGLVPMSGLFCLFIMKDGFNGGSPGKKIADIQVLDEKSGQPIGFGQSFKRNAVLLFGLIPFFGAVVNLVIILVIATQVAKGYRLGDRFAQTRVIWKKYAHLPVFGGMALVCEQCGYDLHGNVSGVCPECGSAVSENNRGQLAQTSQS